MELREMSAVNGELTIEGNKGISYTSKADDENSVIKSTKIDEIFENCSITNRISVKVYLIIMLVIMAEGAEATVVSFLVNILEVEWNFSVFQKGIFGSCGAVGALAGGIFSGSFSDMNGRKPLFIIGTALASLFCFLSAFTSGFYLFSCCRVVYGFGVGISLSSASSLTTEITSTKKRALMLNVIWLFFPVGELYCAVLADNLLVDDDLDMKDNKIENWRKLIIMIGIPCFICAFLTWFVEESPRFLLLKKRYSQAIEVLNRFKESNNQPRLENDEVDQIYKEADELRSTYSTESENYLSNIKTLFSWRYLRLTLLIGSIYFICSASWNGLSYIMPKILIAKQKQDSLNNDTVSNPHDPYRTFIISAVFEIPCTIISSVLAEVKSLGRKGSMILSFVLCVIPGILILLSVPGFTVYMIIIRFLTVIPYGIIYIYNNEVYPTSIRATAMGILASMSKVSSIITPFIMIYLFEITMTLPLLYITIVFVLGAIFSYLLPYESIGINIK